VQQGIVAVSRVHLLIKRVEGRGFVRKAAGAEPLDRPAGAVGYDVLVHHEVSLLEGAARERGVESEIGAGECEPVKPCAGGADEVVEVVS
jgi:hypothetical protein